MLKDPKIPQIVDYKEVEPVMPDRTEDMELRWLVARHPKSYIESPHFQFRVFDINPNGHTSHHIHAWEHVFFVVAGSGYLKTGLGTLPYQEDQFAYVPPYLDHQFFAEKDSPLRMICVIPNPTPQHKLIPLEEDDWGVLFKLKRAIMEDNPMEVSRILNVLYELTPEIKMYHGEMADGMKKTAYTQMLNFIQEVSI